MSSSRLLCRLSYVELGLATCRTRRPIMQGFAAACSLMQGWLGSSGLQASFQASSSAWRTSQGVQHHLDLD